MSLFVKKIGLVLLTLLLLSGCAKKLPPQINEGKAFSKQPYVVQGNLRYSIEDYRVGLMQGDEPAEKNYVSIKILAENIGANKEKIYKENMLLLHKKTAYPINLTKPEGFLNFSLNPGKKSEGWLVFNIAKQPEGIKHLNIGEAKITIE